jgi:hypothetical protein
MIRILAALLALALSASMASAQSRPSKYLSTASTNSTLVRVSEAHLSIIVAVNTTTTVYYLKFYDKAVAPTCNSDVVLFMVPIPFGASNAGGGAVIPIADPGGLFFQQGLGFCITGGSADNDNTNAATGVTVSLGVK